MATPLSPRALSAPLLAWYDAHRRQLPWRENTDPYRVWVSEIMLQQTRVAAVIPYYQRWMEALPDTAALAAAEEERLMKLWQGLGYYSRCRNLQRAARVIMAEHAGRFPQTAEALRALPGIGEYTAGAIASIAFGQPVPAVDGNVLRIFSRLFLLRDEVDLPQVRSAIAGLAAQAVPAARPGAFNQALMDLGSAVCLPRGRPLCETCPLSSLCAAFAAGEADKLPRRRQKKARRQEELTVYLLLRGDEVALRRRDDQGLLAGLWEFPHVPGALAEEQAHRPLAQWGLRPLQWREKLCHRHVFTHVEWRMTAYLLQVEGEGADFCWADQAALAQLAVPSAFSPFLARVETLLSPPAGEEA